MIEKARYNENGSIVATIDEQEYTIPDDLGDRFRRMVAEWEVGGGSITPFRAPPTPAPDRVSARQFKMQLQIMGLLDSVEAWVGQQNRLVQIAYENSATFVRDEPMMLQGFTALGFTEAQIAEFYEAAEKL